MRKNIVCFMVIILIIFTKVFAFYDDEDNVEFDFQIIETVANKNNLNLNSKNAILYDNTYNKILYEKNAYQKVPNASTTKVLTAIVAYEKGNLNDIVMVSKNAAIIGGSGINLRSGDKISLADLIKGLLVHSGNDAAVAIAEHIGGSVDEFCKIMNLKANEMGLSNTNFVTPHGLDRENHYSTAYDLAKMSEYLLEIEFLSSIVKERSVEIKINNQTRIIGTTNEMLSFYTGADGVKTGFTGDAGRCLITSATRDGRQLISVVLGCNTKKERTTDSINLLNFGFENYEITDICKNMKKEFEIKVEKGKAELYKIVLDGEIDMPIEREMIEKIYYEYNIKNDLKAPIYSDENIGEIKIYLEEELLKTIIIKIPQKIEKKSIFDYFYNFLQIDVKNYEIKL